jgi:hypothetical protein
MDLHVLFDRSGKILAAVELKSGSDSEGSAPSPRPEARRGQRTADVTVPDELSHLSFFEACTQLIVQVKGGRTTLIPKRRRSVPSRTARKPAPRKPQKPARRSRTTRR